MKKLFVSFVLSLFLSGTVSSQAQSFIVVNDTIHYATIPAIEDIYDTIVTGTSPVGYSWKVIATDFPSDWIPVAAFCDDDLCYTLATLWPSGSLNNSTLYPAGDTSVLKLALDLGPAATPGCYFVTVRLHNIAIPTDSATETWYVCYTGVTTGVANINTPSVTLYPNPVFNDLTVEYNSPGAGRVEVCDLLGKVVAEQKGSNDKAVISLTNIPHGVYFVRIINMQGAIIASKKFLKE